MSQTTRDGEPYECAARDAYFFSQGLRRCIFLFASSPQRIAGRGSINIICLATERVNDCISKRCDQQDIGTVLTQCTVRCSLGRSIHTLVGFISSRRRSSQQAHDTDPTCNGMRCQQFSLTGRGRFSREWKSPIGGVYATFALSLRTVLSPAVPLQLGVSRQF